MRCILCFAEAAPAPPGKVGTDPLVELLDFNDIGIAGESKIGRLGSFARGNREGNDLQRLNLEVAVAIPGILAGLNPEPPILVVIVIGTVRPDELDNLADRLKRQ